MVMLLRRQHQGFFRPGGEMMVPGIANDPRTVIQNCSQIFNFVCLSLSKRAPAFRQVDHLLTTTSEQLNQHLDHVASLLEEIEAILRFRLGFKRNHNRRFHMQELW
jgi:hypothetical protein